MTTKDKVLALCLQFCKGVQDSQQIMQATGLTEADLDRLWQPAENAMSKARNKPAVMPTGEALEIEVQSWIDYYNWD